MAGCICGAFVVHSWLGAFVVRACCGVQYPVWVESFTRALHGRKKTSVRAATGDTAGDEVEADTGNIDVVNLPGMNLKIGSIGNKFRILIGWLQITAALVISFDVPWPPVTLNLFKGLTFINFNFMDFFAPLDPCTLYTPFLKQAHFTNKRYFT